MAIRMFIIMSIIAMSNTCLGMYGEIDWQKMIIAPVLTMQGDQNVLISQKDLMAATSIIKDNWLMVDWLITNHIIDVNHSINGKVSLLNTALIMKSEQVMLYLVYHGASVNVDNLCFAYDYNNSLETKSLLTSLFICNLGLDLPDEL